eukprot:CAMPEP_0195530574 /NCGR_PEP_ID=MMETSP0794_2-20130614/33519_1 /TAXON_ID=515487 /ORGANISM="Stephanopyxis turris, Strain CCMP 815" /LENGTH=199 /DNA_ID=CAMNT_0040662111 /DNA_START=205 /DNA_END=804 /DNA_ORIENTATION=-
MQQSSSSRRSTRVNRFISPSSQGGGGASDTSNTDRRKVPARKWAHVKRFPAGGGTFLVPKWTPVSELTPEEKNEYTQKVNSKNEVVPQNKDQTGEEDLQTKPKHEASSYEEEHERTDIRNDNSSRSMTTLMAAAAQSEMPNPTIPMQTTKHNDKPVATSDDVEDAVAGTCKSETDIAEAEEKSPSDDDSRPIKKVRLGE